MISDEMNYFWLIRLPEGNIGYIIELVIQTFQQEYSLKIT